MENNRDDEEAGTEEKYKETKRKHKNRKDNVMTKLYNLIGIALLKVSSSFSVLTREKRVDTTSQHRGEDFKPFLSSLSSFSIERTITTTKLSLKQCSLEFFQLKI